MNGDNTVIMPQTLVVMKKWYFEKYIANKMFLNCDNYKTIINN